MFFNAVALTCAAQYAARKRVLVFSAACKKIRHFRAFFFAAFSRGFLRYPIAPNFGACEPKRKMKYAARRFKDIFFIFVKSHFLSKMFSSLNRRLPARSEERGGLFD
ncbi:MAG: hypothetical protein DBX55_02795 [Verrucomicrobia bacterium]|nr:MAG: hypothetical protein DBX55_02795 [Verrucomicrobiota bacterium]